MAHDETAIAALYRETYAQSYSLAYHLCHNESAAEDILQESYIAAFSGLKNLNNKANFRRWLRGIILNKWRDYCKDLSHSYGISLYTSEESPQEDWQLALSAQEIVENTQTNREIWQLVNQLPEHQRVCMILFYYENMKIEEIAEVLEIPAGSVKSRLYYGRERLKKEIEQRGLNSAVLFQPPVVKGAAVDSGLLAKVLAALETASDSSTAAAAAKTAGIGRLFRLGLVSLITVGSMVGALKIWPHRPQPRPELPAAATTVTTTSTVSATTAMTTAPVTTTTAPPVTTTTAAPQPFVSFDYRAVSGGVAITRYNGSDGRVVIPDTLDGQPVVAIGANAFQYCSALESVVISDYVNEIGDNAFRECTHLRSVTLGGGVSAIGDMAFLGCSSLSSLSVPPNVREIGIYAFAYCTSLTSVTISEGTQILGYSAFSQCPSLRRVSMPASVYDIGNDEFGGASSDLTLYVADGSYAQEYAEENGFTYFINS